MLILFRFSFNLFRDQIYPCLEIFNEGYINLLRKD